MNFSYRKSKSKKKNSKSTKSLKGAKESKKSMKKVKKDAPKGTEVSEIVPTVSTLPEEDVYDENDITTMLPNQPTLEEVGDPDTLRILQESRETLVSKWNEIDSDEWVKGKEKNGAVVYRRDCSTGVSFKRCMQVESDVDAALNCFRDLELAKKHNDRIQKIDVVENLTDDCILMHHVNKGSIFASSRDF